MSDVTEFDAGPGMPAAFLGAGRPSFVELLTRHAPGLLPVNRSPLEQAEIRHGTTVLALTFAGGVMMAGDRRATPGNMIAKRGVQKGQPADQYSAVGFAGALGIAVE